MSKKNIIRIVCVVVFVIALIVACVSKVRYIFEGDNRVATTNAALFGASEVSYTYSGKTYWSSLQPMWFQIFGLCLAILGLVLSFVFKSKDEGANKIANIFFSVLILFGATALFFANKSSEYNLLTVKNVIGTTNDLEKIEAGGFVVSGVLLIILAILIIANSLVPEESEYLDSCPNFNRDSVSTSNATPDTGTVKTTPTSVVLPEPEESLYEGDKLRVVYQNGSVNDDYEIKKLKILYQSGAISDEYYTQRMKELTGGEVLTINQIIDSVNSPETQAEAINNLRLLYFNDEITPEEFEKYKQEVYNKQLE